MKQIQNYLPAQAVSNTSPATSRQSLEYPFNKFEIAHSFRTGFFYYTIHIFLLWSETKKRLLFLNVFSFLVLFFAFLIVVLVPTQNSRRKIRIEILNFEIVLTGTKYFSLVLLRTLCLLLPASNDNNYLNRWKAGIYFLLNMY